MNLIDTMFLWMPVNEDRYGKNPRQGRVIAVPRGQNDPVYPMSAGACDHDWNEAGTHAERVALLQSYVSVMIWHDNVSRDSVLSALAQIDDLDPGQIDLDAQPVWPDGD